MGWLSVAPLIFIFAIFYFLLILPQQRRQKKWTAMLDSLKTGDKVVTSGGFTRFRRATQTPFNLIFEARP